MEATCIRTGGTTKLRSKICNFRHICRAGSVAFAACAGLEFLRLAVLTGYLQRCGAG